MLHLMFIYLFNVYDTIWKRITQKADRQFVSLI